VGRDKRPASAERYISVGLKLLNSPAYIALDRSAQALFFDLRTKFKGGYNNGNINAALSELRHRGWSSETTLAKALRQLQATGFIAATRRTVGVEKGSKVCNLYRFTDCEVFAQPKVSLEAIRATHDYLKIETLAHARRIVKDASAPKPLPEAAKEKRKKTTMQKLHRQPRSTMQKLHPPSPHRLQKLHRRRVPENSANPRQSTVSSRLRFLRPMPKSRCRNCIPI